MLPRWAYGFIQSKDRYTSLDEIQAIASRYRAEHIPIDTIVQDWFWWEHEGDPDLQLQLPRRSRRPRQTPRPALPHHDLHLGHDGPRLRDLQETRRRAPPPRRRARLRCQQPARPRPLLAEPARPALRPGLGLLLARLRRTRGILPAHRRRHPHHRATSPSATAPLTPTSIRCCTTKASSRTGARPPTRSASSCSPAPPSSARSASAARSGPATFTPASGALTHQVAGGLNYALSGLPYWTTDIGGYWPTCDPTRPSTRNSTCAGSSSAPSTPSSAPTATARTTRCGPTRSSSPPSSTSTSSVIA